MKLFSLLLFITLFFSCVSKKEEVVEKDPYAKNYRDDFIDKKQPFWNSFQLKDPDRAIVVPDSTDPDNEVLKVSITPFDTIAKGIRSELVINAKDSFGYLNKNTFRFKFPKSFFKTEKLPGKIAIMQWHDRPFPGFDWKTKKIVVLPPFYLYINHTPDGKFELLLHTGIRIGNIDNFVIAKWPGILEPDVWYEFENEIFWSLYNDGYIKPKVNNTCFEINNVDICSFEGPNMYHIVPNYFKMGLYYNKPHEFNRYIYFDEVCMQSTRVAYFPQKSMENGTLDFN